jgi:hypothetical protein
MDVDARGGVAFCAQAVAHSNSEDAINRAANPFLVFMMLLLLAEQKDRSMREVHAPIGKPIHQAGEESH